MIPALLVAVAVVLAQALPTSTVAFNDDATWGADVGFELETPTGVVPCSNLPPVGAERRCQVLIPRTSDQTVRLRAVQSGIVSGWSVPFGAPAVLGGPLPGMPTIRGFKALP